MIMDVAFVAVVDVVIITLFTFHDSVSRPTSGGFGHSDDFVRSDCDCFHTSNRCCN